ncbi:hypothetical protein [Francisella philomiragia]|nr:hypothetical protein [Francisella philomiragia]
MTYQYATAKKESNETTQEQQQEVKTQVMKLLEEEYKQPFKLEDFSYKYERHWVDNSCQLSLCEMEKYGTYHFEIQAVDNPIIELEFNIDDENKESIKDVVDSFKKNQLSKVYCTAFSEIYMYDKQKSVDESYLKKAKNYCDSRNQKGYEHWMNLYKYQK